MSQWSCTNGSNRLTWGFFLFGWLFCLFLFFFPFFEPLRRHLRHKTMRNCKQAHVGWPRGVIAGCRIGDSSPRKSAALRTVEDAHCAPSSASKKLTREHLHLGSKTARLATEAFLQFGHSSVTYYHCHQWALLEAGPSTWTLPSSSQMVELQFHFVNSHMGRQHWRLASKFKDAEPTLKPSETWNCAAEMDSEFE